MKNKIILLSILLVIVTGCNKSSKGSEPDSRFLWEKDQILISPSEAGYNLWSGFKAENNRFENTNRVSKLIFFRKRSGKENVGIEYQLNNGRCEIYLNGVKKFNLFAAGAKRSIKKRVNLLKGFNFLEFRLFGKGTLKVSSLHIGKIIPHKDISLNTGDRIVRYLSTGSGKITFNGKGRIRIKKVEFHEGKKKVDSKEFTANTQSMKNFKYALDMKTVGFIELSVLSGEVGKILFDFKPEKRTEPVYKVPEINGPFDVYILLIDGCHASHLGIYGYERNTSPAIDRFAKDSVVFDNAYANASFTRSSVASIFTGFYPQRHKVLILKSRLPNNLFIMPEFFKEKGYKTGIITEAGNISMVFGFKQGVTEYHKAFFRWDDPRYLKRNNITFFREWIENRSPLFTYVHFREPHFPIVPPAPYRDMFGKRKSKNGKRVIFRIAEYDRAGHKYTKDEKEEIINDYDSSIRHVTDSVDKLLDMLRKKGKYDNSIIIFTADHGEAVYEHKAWGHGSNVYNETTRVPLIVKFPSYFNLKGIRVKRLVQLVDLFPTFASLYGESRLFDGESLFKSMKISDTDDRFVFSTSFNIPQSFGIRWRNWYYIIDLKDNKEELINLNGDPFRDLSENNGDVLIFFRSKFLDWLHKYDNLKQTGQYVDLKKLPKGERDNLKSLGYIN